MGLSSLRSSSAAADCCRIVLVLGFIVHDALLLLVALFRPSSVSAAYLSLCLLAYQGVSTSQVTASRNLRLAAAAAVAAIGLGLGLANSVAARPSLATMPAAWVADLVVLIESGVLCAAGTRHWLTHRSKRHVPSPWGRVLERHGQSALLLLLLTVAALQPCLLALSVLLPACCGLFAWAVRADRALALLRRLVPLAQPYLAVWAVALYTQQLLLLLHEQTGEPP